MGLAHGEELVWRLISVLAIVSVRGVRSRAIEILEMRCLALPS